MAQRTTPIQTPEVESAPAETTTECCHHWVIQPADGPISIGSCQVCGETREFKNYVEAATWGDTRAPGKNATASAATPSTSDDGDIGSHDLVDVGAEPDSDDSEMESEE